MSSYKCVCKECGERCVHTEVLTAPNPFAPHDTISGCPKCKSVDSFLMACEVGDCWKEASCGTPTTAGYANTCGEHRPVESEPAPHE